MRVNGIPTRKRTVADVLRLEVPDGKARAFCQRYGYGNWQTMKPIHRKKLLTASETEIILTYNSELRGLANYYALADDFKSKLHKLEYLAHYSLCKTLAGKRKTSIGQVISRLREGGEFIHKYEIQGAIQTLKVFRLKHMESGVKQHGVDSIPYIPHLTLARSELVQRLNARICEYCGVSDCACQVHHIRKLKDLECRPNLMLWEKRMIAMRRKTYVLCPECHTLLHAGKLPDKRYQEKSLTG